MSEDEYLHEKYRQVSELVHENEELLSPLPTLSKVFTLAQTEAGKGELQRDPEYRRIVKTLAALKDSDLSEWASSMNRSGSVDSFNFYYGEAVQIRELFQKYLGMEETKPTLQ